MNPIDPTSPRTPEFSEGPNADDFAPVLAAMSRWEEPDPALWEKALARVPRRRWTWTIPTKYVALATAAVVVLAAGIALNTAFRAKSSYRVASNDFIAHAPEMLLRAAPPAASSPPAVANSSLMLMDAPATDSASKRVAPRDGATGTQTIPGDRSIVRKATVELKTHDVRAAFAKAGQVPSAARGEYIEQSSLTGTGPQMEASMTLRVEAARLSAVLTELAGLAEVASQSSGGEDVTDQVVDVEARLRNEQRVETELLTLMQSRKDAPLKDILELRDSLSNVRERIERLTAQRDRYARLVSLATILVIIRPDTAAPAPLPEGIADYFKKQVTRAWDSALGFLADSVAFLISVVVGGAMIWVLLSLLIAIGLVWRRHSLRSRGQERAPPL